MILPLAHIMEFPVNKLSEFIHVEGIEFYEDFDFADLKFYFFLF